MNPIEARILEVERRLIHLTTATRALRRQAVRVAQNMIESEYIPGSGGVSTWEYVLTVYGVNSRVAFGQDVELQDFYGTVLDSGTTNGSGEITLYAPTDYGGSGLYLIPAPSNGRQRFDLAGVALIDGGDTTSATFAAATDYYAIDGCAWPIYKDIDVDDPDLNCNQTVSYDSAQLWIGPESMTVNYGGCSSPTCPSVTLTDCYFTLDLDGGQLLGRLYYTAGPACPATGEPFNSGSPADLTMTEGLTPVLTGEARSGQTIWCGGTPTWTITEL